MIDSYEIIGLIGATLTTAAYVPQVYKTWKTKDVSGLSLPILKSLAMILANSVTAILTLIILIFKLRYK